MNVLKRNTAIVLTGIASGAAGSGLIGYVNSPLAETYKEVGTKRIQCANQIGKAATFQSLSQNCVNALREVDPEGISFESYYQNQEMPGEDFVRETGMYELESATRMDADSRRFGIGLGVVLWLIAMAEISEARREKNAQKATKIV